MKKLLFLVFLTSSAGVFAQGGSIKPHELSADFGSLRNRYLFPFTNLSYSSRDFTSLHLILGARLRSYGTLYFFSNSAYDFTPQASIVLHSSERGFYFTAGAGADVRLRLVKDVRSHTESSAEPMLTLSANYSNATFALSLPVWNRFYTNGISFATLPQFGFRLSPTWSLLTRYEITWIKLYGSSSEWRRDWFVGCSMEF